MKLTKSRKNYTCHNCKAAIGKGDLYKRKTITIGNPKKETWEKTEMGSVALVSHGISVSVKHCKVCA